MLKTLSYLVILIFFAKNSYAHNCGGKCKEHKPIVSISFEDVKDPKTLDEFEKTIIHEAHEVIEGEEQGRLISDWLNKFNLKAKFIDAYRWYSSHSDKKYRDLALDSVFIFSISHLLEMSSGPITFSYGYQNNWPSWVLALIGTGGAIISAPGLDPLCLIIFATYYKSPKFRARVSKLRVGIFSAGSTAINHSGLKKLFHRYFSPKSAFFNLYYSQNLSRIFHHALHTDLKFDIKDQNDKIVGSYVFTISRKSSYLSQLSFDNEDFRNLDKRILKKQISNLNWNAKNFITSIHSDIINGREITPKGYISDIDKSSGGRTVVIPKSMAIKAKTGIQFKQKLKCQELFLR